MASSLFRSGRQSWRQVSKLAAVAGAVPATAPGNFAVRHFAAAAGSSSGGGGGTVRMVLLLPDLLPDCKQRASCDLETTFVVAEVVSRSGRCNRWRLGRSSLRVPGQCSWSPPTRV